MFEAFKDALRTAFSQKLTYIALVAVPTIVGLFGLLYVFTFTDPIGNFADVPVALVNLDEGATVGGESKNYGAELAESLEGNDNARWVPEDASLVDSGLENTDYYLAVIVPADFSRRVAAGETAAPEQAGIVFYRNMRKNYMLGTLATRIESKLSQEINEKVSAQYAEALAEGLEGARDGLSEAADGANRLSEGAASLAEGTDAALDGASVLSTGSGALQDGANELAAGACSLADGASKVQEGLATLTGNNDALLQGWDALSAGTESLASGSAQLAEGSAAYAAGLEEAYAAASANADTSGAQAQLEQALAAYGQASAAAAITGDASDAEAALGEIQQAVGLLSQASGHAGAAQALAGARDGFAQVDAGISSIAEGSSGLQSGAQEFDEALRAYTGGVSAAAEGSKQVAEGASSAAEGVNSLASGAGELAGGAASLAAGMRQLRDGEGKLIDGSNELASSLEDGRADIAAGLTASPAEYGAYISNPVEVAEESYGQMEYFGYGFAPFFMTLCFWLGSLLVFFVFEPFPSYRHIHVGRFAAVFGRWPLYLLMLALEVAVVCGGSALIGIPHVDTNAYVLHFCVVAFTFMCIMQLLNLFGIPGKAVAILILILQICCASGTFPAILANGYAQAVAPFLPFTYSIDAFRELLSGGNLGVAYADMGMLLAFAVGAIALTLAVYPLALKLKMRRDREALAELSLMPQHAR